MSDLDRGIMKFKNADKPLVVTLTAVITLGSIVALLIWATQSAYAT